MGLMQPGSMAAPLALARSYLHSIVNVVTRLQARERNQGAKGRLYEKALQLIQDIDERLNDVGPPWVLPENFGEQLDQLNSALQKSRSALRTAQTPLDLETVLEDLRVAAMQLQQGQSLFEKPEQNLTAPGIDTAGENSTFPETPIRDTAVGNAMRTEMLFHNAHEDQSAGDLLRKLRQHKPGLHLAFKPSSPSSQDEINIVLVHGLNDNAVESWAGRSRDKPFWPRDFLAKDLPACRVWIYSYDSRLKSDQNLGSLGEIASDLRHRVEKQTQGPLIWVAHSLGSIVVKLVFIISQEQPFRNGREDILTRTRGIIFIGTPHTGTSLSSRTMRVSNILSLFGENTKAPQEVHGVESALLIVPSKFATLLGVGDFIIISMFETDKSITKDGPRLIVESSNRLSHAQEIVVHVPGTHRSMCKFENRVEEGYRKTLSYLKIIIQSTKTQFRDFEPPPTERKTITAFTDSETVDISASKNKVQMQLDNPITRWSPAKTDDPDIGTWFPKHSPEYKRWLDEDDKSPLLILGPFGSGKSMVMESILDDLRMRSNEADDSLQTCHLHLFFRSNQIAQQTTVAILESFVAQALDQNDNLTGQLVAALRAIEDDRRAGARESILTATLRSILENSSWRRIYLVVDALDECDNSRVESTCEIFSWMLEVPRLRAIFSSIDDTNTSSRSEEGKMKSLLARLQRQLREQSLYLNPIELNRWYIPWKAALTDHINKRLGLNGYSDEKLDKKWRSKPEHFRHSLRDALINFPHGSFSVVQLLLQHLAENQHVMDAFETNPDSLVDVVTTVRHQDQLSMIVQGLLQSQAKQGIYVLSVLACAREPLGLLDIAAFKVFENGTGSWDPSKLFQIARGIMSEITAPRMANLIVMDARGLRVSSDVVRKGVKRQMKTAPSVSASRDDDKNTFINYQYMHLHLFRACTGLLAFSRNRHDNNRGQGQWPNDRELPGVKYAQRNWGSHLQKCVKLAVRLASIDVRYNLASGSGSEPLNIVHAADHSRLLWSSVQRKLNDSGSDLEADPLADRRNLLWLMLLETFAAENLLGHTPTTHITSEHIRLVRILTEGNLGAKIRLEPDRLKLLESLTDSGSMPTQISSTLSIIEFLSSISNVQNLQTELQAEALIPKSSVDLSDMVLMMDRSRLGPSDIDLANSLNLDQFLSNAHLSLEGLGSSSLDATLAGVGSGIDLDFDDRWRDDDKRSSAQKEDSSSYELQAIKNAQAGTVKSVRSAPDYALSWLEVAFRGRNHKGVGEILQHCANEVVKLPPQNRLLDFPVRSQNHKLVQLMLNSQQDFDLHSSLIVAAGSAGPDICEDLLRHGAPVDSQKQVKGPLHLAAERGHDEIVKILLKWNASVDGVDENGYSPLHLASRNGHTFIVEALLVNGASLFHRTKDKKSPFFLACEHGHRPTAEVLFRFGARLDEKSDGGLSVLHAAARAGRLEIADMLLKAGLSPDVRDDLDVTPLHLAAERGWESIGQILLEAGANTSITCLGAATPLHFASTCAASPEAFIEVLLRHGADLHARDELGRTPTHLAAHFSTVRALSLLVAEERSVLDAVDFSHHGVYDYAHHPTVGEGKISSSSIKRREDDNLSRQKQKEEFLSLYGLNARSKTLDPKWEVITIRDLCLKTQGLKQTEETALHSCTTQHGTGEPDTSKERGAEVPRPPIPSRKARVKAHVVTWGRQIWTDWYRSRTFLTRRFDRETTVDLR